MKKLMWYITIIPLTFITVVWSLMMWIPAVLMASTEVMFNLLARYEYWCFDVSDEGVINSPFKTPLKQVFIKALEGF